MEEQKRDFNPRVGIKTSLTIWYYIKFVPFIKRLFAKREKILVNFLIELYDIQKNIAVIDEFRKVKYIKKMIDDYVKSRDMYNITSF